MSFSDRELIDIANEAKILAVGAYSLVYDICDGKGLTKRDELDVEKLCYHGDSFKLYGYEECDIPKFLRIRSLSEFQLYVNEFVREGLSASQIVGKLEDEINDFADILCKPALYNLGISLRKEDCFWAYIHPKIRKVSFVAFKSRLYADAVESAFKEINVVVKNRALARLKQEFDGQTLMHHVFSPKNPILVVEANLDTQTNKDTQQGYMMMFSGAMSAIRNPKAHENMVISKEEAIRKLMFASMLMYKLDESHFVEDDLN